MHKPSTYFTAISTMQAPVYLLVKAQEYFVVTSLRIR